MKQYSTCKFMQLLKPLGYTYWPLTIISRSIKFVKEDILSRLPPPLALIMFLRQWKHWSMHQQRDHLCHPQMFAFLHKQMPLISLKWQNASPYSERISHFLNTKGMFHFFFILFLNTNYFANTYQVYLIFSKCTKGNSFRNSSVFWENVA